jgi:RNA polymerase sigma factor (sigma-70 family)
LDNAQLVAAVRGGDGAAFTELYERYERLIFNRCRLLLAGDDEAAKDATSETFRVAFAGRLKGLRDPQKLTAWLWTVSKRMAIRQYRANRTVLMADVPEQPVDDDLDSIDPRWAEQVLIAASAALDEADRQLLPDFQLIVTDRITRRDVADSRGMSTDHLNVSLSRLKQRLDEAVVLVLLKPARRQKCGGLQEQIRRTGADITPRLRKAVARHIRDCATCESHRERVLITAGLLAAIPFLPAPDDLRVPDVTPVSFQRSLTRRLVAAAAVLLVLALLYVVAWRSRGPSDVDAAVSPQAESAVTTTTTSGSPVETTTSPAAQSSPGESSSGGSVQSSVSSSVSASASMSSSSTSPVVDTSGPAIASPVLSATTLSQVWNGQACGGQATSVTVSVGVSDPSDVAGVVLSGTIAGRTRTWTMQDAKTGAWTTSVSYGIDDHTGKSGQIVLTATATDKAGNSSNAQVGQVQLISCTPG